MGLKLSLIQGFAVEMAMLLDDQEKARDRTDRFKLALVGSDPKFWVGRLFAEELDDGKEETAFEDIDWDDEAGTAGMWVMPEITEDEFMALERELAERKGTLTVQDLEEGEWL